ncbi:hypothetical protein G6F68_013728 [Rhizopus microsporus]|nr:hypothetical protein G6F68_013728 [Rhizopus microsporus]
MATATIARFAAPLRPTWASCLPPCPWAPPPAAAPSPTRRCSSWRPIPFMPGARPSRAHRPRTKSAPHCRLMAASVRVCPPSPPARCARALCAPARVPSPRPLRPAL